MINPCTISIINLLKETFLTVRKDFSVILPFLITSFILFLFSTTFLKPFTEVTEQSELPLEALYFYGGGWLLSLLAQATTIFMAVSINQENVADISDAFNKAVKRFLSLLLLHILLIGLLTILALLLNHALKEFFIYAAIPFIVGTLIFFQLFPVIFLLNKESLFSYYGMTFRFIKNNIQNTLRFFIGMSLISLLTILLISLLTPLGALLKSVVAPLLQGLNNAFLTIFAVHFYLKTKSTVSTHV